MSAGHAQPIYIALPGTRRDPLHTASIFFSSLPHHHPTPHVWLRLMWSCGLLRKVVPETTPRSLRWEPFCAPGVHLEHALRARVHMGNAGVHGASSGLFTLPIPYHAIYYSPTVFTLPSLPVHTPYQRLVLFCLVFRV
jgi:hypothetical protein